MSMSQEDILEEIRRLQDDCSMLRNLLETPGHTWMMNQIQTTYTAKTLELIKPPSDIADEQSRTYIAGEARALMYVINLVKQALVGQESSIRALERSVHNDDFEENN